MKVDHYQDILHGIKKWDFPVILKTRKNGYDGKGQLVLKKWSDIYADHPFFNNRELIMEPMIPFDFEVSLIAVRDSNFNVQFYPMSLNYHQGGILRHTEAPYEDVSLTQKARDYALRILEKVNYVGVLALEFFCVNTHLIVNEIAPRVHNTGHWTIEGAITSQFENHLRAILAMPLGATNAIGHTTMINIISQYPKNINDLIKISGLHIYDYGKSPRENRKLGHITIQNPDKGKLRVIVNEVIELLGPVYISTMLA